MNKLSPIAVSLLVLLIVLSGCKTTQKSSRIKEAEVSYVDPYLGKMDNELSITELYIKTYRDLAIQEMRRSKIPASITLAQGILESGNGNSYLAKKASNHFGIKCGSNWTGEAIYFDDDEANECFRKYTNPKESYIDHSDFLTNSDRYAGLFSLDIKDYKGWAKGLKSAGYATRRNYAELLIDMIEKHNLTGYDIAIPKEKADKIVYQADEQFKYNGITAILAKENDTYNEIAKRNSISVSKLLEYNDLKEPIPLKTGAVVYLSPKKTVAKESYHIVKKDDRMYSISQEYGIKLAALYSKNLLREGDEPAIGEILYLRQKRSDPAETRTISKEAVIAAVDDKEVIEKDILVEKIVEKETPTIEEFTTEEKNDEKEVKLKESTSKIVFEDEEFAEVPTSDKKTEEAVEAKTTDEKHSGETVQMHQVEAGESLYSISKKYGVSVDELKAWNNLPNNDLNVNDKLIVSKSMKPFKTDEKLAVSETVESKPVVDFSNSDTVFHTVKAGESFYTISQKYDMTIIDLIALNNLKEYKIETGQKLIIKLPDKPIVVEAPKKESSSTEDFYIDKSKMTKTTPLKEPKAEERVSADALTHIVEAGETLYSISKKYRVSIDEIKRLNGLNSNILSIGQKLAIESNSAAKSKAEKAVDSETADGYHLVESGETLYSISRKYNISVEKLKEINGLSSNLLSIGQKLKVK